MITPESREYMIQIANMQAKTPEARERTIRAIHEAPEHADLWKVMANTLTPQPGKLMFKTSLTESALDDEMKYIEDIVFNSAKAYAQGCGYSTDGDWTYFNTEVGKGIAQAQSELATQETPDHANARRISNGIMDTVTKTLATRCPKGQQPQAPTSTAPIAAPDQQGQPQIGTVEYIVGGKPSTVGTEDPNLKAFNTQDLLIPTSQP